MHEFRAMNTTIRTFLLGEKEREKIEQWFRWAERMLSRFREDSELSQLNRSAGKLFVPSPLLFHVLAAADFYYKETDGIFHPYLAHTLCQIGYDRSFETISPDFVYEGSDNQSILSPLIIDERMKSVMLSEGVAVDLGGIAKGWSAQQMSRQLRKGGVQQGVIDAGGDIVIWGEKKGGWKVAIADPFNHERDCVVVTLHRGAGIATSSTMKRRWHDRSGKEFHHIIDATTGCSSHSDLVQATVFAQDATTAEVYAKCLLILGWEYGMAWMSEKRRGLGAIGVRNDGTVVIGGCMENYVAEVENGARTVC